MEFPGFLLTLVTFLPLVGSLIILLLPKKSENLIKYFSLGVTLVALALAIVIWTQFKTGVPGYPISQELDWIPQMGIKYHLGVDGMSMLLMFLTTLLSVTACLASFTIKNRVKEYFSLFLLLETGLIGVFLALDLVMFYVFWEIVLVPMYFLIAIWGGERKLYASIKFFIYTLVGSLFMLVAILAIYFTAPTHTFSIPELVKASGSFANWALALPAFGAMFLAFAIKIPAFPFHTWLPDAHVEAPAPISVMLAGVLLKMGGYGLIRIGVGILPDAAKAWALPMAILAVIGIVYGAFCSLIQKDLKKLVAYTSVNHMGFVLLAIAAFAWNPTSQAAMQGAILVMFSHGLTTGLMFLLVGYIYEREHTREIAKLSGMGSKIPVIAIMMIIASFASMGLPALSGFVGEFLSLNGAYSADILQWTPWVAVIGLLINAACMLWMMQRVMFGKPKGAPETDDAHGHATHDDHAVAPVHDEAHPPVKDANFREIIAALPLFGFSFFVGIFPLPFITIINQMFIK
ncbi:MAG: NADH-quinone oxidoreductase subunit M [Caldisericia bacterium]|nr:NADH-quinone oxidoreductase subunit M [Caldisericia bacterium]